MTSCPGCQRPITPCEDQKVCANWLALKQARYLDEVEREEERLRQGKEPLVRVGRDYRLKNV